MNPEAQEELTRILNSDPESLTPADIAFLNARRGYLNKEQRRVFASVLIDEQADPAILGNTGEAEDSTPKVEVKEEVKKEEPTTADLVAKAKELGVSNEAIAATKTNEELAALIENPVEEKSDDFSDKGNADPDAK